MYYVLKELDLKYVSNNDLNLNMIPSRYLKLKKRVEIGI